jgi:hypothetical protein
MRRAKSIIGQRPPLSWWLGTILPRCKDDKLHWVRNNISIAINGHLKLDQPVTSQILPRAALHFTSRELNALVQQAFLSLDVVVLFLANATSYINTPVQDCF